MSSISGIASSSSMMQGMQGMRGMKKPDPAEMADNLFSKLDTSGQGFIQKSDLQSAFAQISSSSQASDTSSNVDELFSQLDTDSDGKVTKQEFSDTLQKLSEQLEQQFQSSRMQGAMQAGGMPPPPPPGGGDQGMSKEQLSSAAAEIGSTDSGLASMLSNVAENFDAADTNSDGKVSLQETIAYEQSKSNASSLTGATSSASSSSASSSSTSSTSAGADLEGNVMRQIMKLMQAYGPGNDGNTATSSLSLMA
ncbi:MAG: EF-hand domain-containing protein [Rhodocyclaceae bacterium]